MIGGQDLKENSLANAKHHLWLQQDQSSKRWMFNACMMESYNTHDDYYYSSDEDRSEACMTGEITNVPAKESYCADVGGAFLKYRIR